MTTEKKGIVQALWDGPFYIGPLSRPVSVGDVLLKTLETLWRAALSIVVLLTVGGLGIAAWVQIIKPTLFPPLKTQIYATATYDDGSATDLPTIGKKPLRCTPDYPIKIAFRNDSSKPIGFISFSIEGRAANRSTNVIKDASWRYTDVIIPSGRTGIFCSSVAVEDGFDPKAISYEIEILEANQADINTLFSPTARSSSIDQTSETPSRATNASPTPSPSSTGTLGTIKDADWQKIGMGCACSFSTGMPQKIKLIAGGGLTFFRLNGNDRLCPAPGTETLVDGPVSMSCGSATVQVTPYGNIEPGGDGHSSKASLYVTESSRTLSLRGTWTCSC